MIRDCAVDDFGNFCQEFEPRLPDAAAAVSSQHQELNNHEICVTSCHSSLCNKQPIVNPLTGT